MALKGGENVQHALQLHPGRVGRVKVKQKWRSIPFMHRGGECFAAVRCRICCECTENGGKKVLFVAFVLFISRV